MGHKINGGNDDDNPTHFMFDGWSRKYRETQSCYEEISLAPAGNIDVGRCRVEEVGTMTDMVGELEGTVAAEEVSISEATLLMLLLGLGEVRALKVAVNLKATT